MKDAPNLHTIDNVLMLVSTTQMSPDGNKWYPARPMGYDSLRSRLRLAWLVFTGKCDALRWPAGQ